MITVISIVCIILGSAVASLSTILNTVNGDKTWHLILGLLGAVMFFGGWITLGWLVLRWVAGWAP